jgi:hypothetical protein
VRNVSCPLLTSGVILGELEKLKEGKVWTKFNELLYTLTMNDTHLMKEEVPLSKAVKEKLYSAIW